MEPTTFQKLCRARAKYEGLSALKLSNTTYAVRSRDTYPGMRYLVVTNPEGAPIGCVIDGEECKSFFYRGYCTHAGATENSIARRLKRSPRPVKPARKRELSDKTRTALLKEIELLESAQPPTLAQAQLV